MPWFDQVAAVLASHRLPDETLGLVLEVENGIRVEQHLKSLPGDSQHLRLPGGPQQRFRGALDEGDIPDPLTELVVLPTVGAGEPQLLRQGRADLDVQRAGDLPDLQFALLPQLLQLLWF